MGMLKRGMPSSLDSTRDRSWIARSLSRMSSAIFVTRISPPSVESSAHRGRNPDATIVKTTARSRGLYASSKGQLMKTDCAVTDLVARRFATRMPVLGPQGIANGPGSVGTRTAHGSDFDAGDAKGAASIGVLAGPRRSWCEALEPVRGQAISWRMSRTVFGSYDADLLKHFYVVLDLELIQVQRVCDFIEDGGLLQLARFPKNPENSEYDCCITFRHICLRRGSILRNNLIRWM